MKKPLFLLIAISTMLAGFSSINLTKKNNEVKAEQETVTLTLEVDQLPIVGDIPNVTIYGNKTCLVKTEVPGLSGFKGKVLEVSNDSDVGLTFDFGEKAIPVNNIKSMNIRYYITNGRAFRITKEAGNTKPYWEVNNETTSADYNIWSDLTLFKDGTGFSNSCTFNDLANSFGNLGAFNLCSRSGVKFYIDDISITYTKEISETETTTFDAHEIPIDESIEGVARYLNKSKTIIEAASAPAGATGKVLKLEAIPNEGGVGTIFNFNDAFVVGNVISIKFRFYADSTNETRITTSVGQGAKAWLMRYQMSASSNKWITVELNKNGANFYDNANMNDFANEDGFFKPFNFCTRNGSIIYIDNVVIETKKGDHVLPTFDQDISSLTFRSGTRPQFNFTATDNVDGKIPVKIVYPDGAIDKNGKLVKGTYIITLIAVDSSNNKATKNIDLIVL